MGTDVERIVEAIRGLAPEDRARLAAEVWPELCRAVMARPDLMATVMAMCQQAQTDSETRHPMRPMMERMMKSMAGGG